MSVTNKTTFFIWERLTSSNEIQLMFTFCLHDFDLVFSDMCGRVFSFYIACTEPCNTKQICNDTSHTQPQPETKNIFKINQ